MNTGRTGIITFVTIESTICWNSSRTFVIVFASVHVAASPIMSENTSALITDMICGISSWNTTSGSSFYPSTSEVIDICGIIIYPAAIENNAAPTEDT